MKIAIVLNTSWNVWNFRKGLICEFLRNGHEVIVIAPRDHYSDKLSELGCTYVPIKMDSRGINPLKDLALFAELFLAYRKISPDLILHFTVKPNIYGSIAAGLLGIKSIPNVCGLGTLFLNPGLTTKLAIILYRVAFSFPYKVFFQNKDDQKFFVSNRIVPENKCLQIPGSGVDTRFFRPMPTQLKKQEQIKLLMISRIILDKGIFEFISAAHYLRSKGYPVACSIVGQLDPRHKRGISKAKFKEWLDWSGVTYLGFKDDLRELINNSDAVVLPSYREGTPKSLLEAAACGKPLITTNVPGCKEVVIQNHNGLLCKPRSVDSLSQAMEKFCQMGIWEKRRMSLNSRTLAEEKFNERLILEAYGNLLAVDSKTTLQPIKEPA